MANSTEIYFIFKPLLGTNASQQITRYALPRIKKEMVFQLRKEYLRRICSWNENKLICRPGHETSFVGIIVSIICDMWNDDYAKERYSLHLHPTDFDVDKLLSSSHIK